MNNLIIQPLVYFATNAITQAIGDHVKYRLRQSIYDAGVTAIGSTAAAWVGNAQYIGPAMNCLGRGVGHIVMPSVVENAAAVTVLATTSSIATATIPAIASIAAPYLVAKIKNAYDEATNKKTADDLNEIPDDLDDVYDHNIQIIKVDDSDKINADNKISEINEEFINEEFIDLHDHSSQIIKVDDSDQPNKGHEEFVELIKSNQIDS